MSQLCSEFPAWLSHALTALKNKDIPGWMAIYTEDATHQFPFAPPGAPVRLEGKAQIQAFMQQLPQLLQFGELTDIRVRETGDEIIAEAVGHHTRLADGKPLTINYVWFITQKQGKVSNFTDYMNPLQLAEL